MASREESRAVSPELSVLRPSIVFSTLKPSSKTVKELKDGTLALKLEPGEVSGWYRLVLRNHAKDVQETCYPRAV